MDPADLAEALGNVLDNATRFAKGVIAVSAAREGEVIRLDVEDDGPGVDDSALADIVGRGVHLGEGEGSGLGLAISAEVLSAYRGGLSFGRSPLGGLKVTLLLPARSGSGNQG
jgi:signal transduction histidine kinase